MIICPICKEEIEDNSRFCDQCGAELHYCNRCGRVGMGRRCTNCGGLMVSPDALNTNMSMSQTSYSYSNPSLRMDQYSISNVSQRAISAVDMRFPQSQPQANSALPSLALVNSSLAIRLDAINGAVIGRKQGPYVNYFQSNMYVSGVHAQLRYKATIGWCIVDMHSSNGTKLNDRAMQPDVEMSLKDGDIVSIANINLQVKINN